MPEFNQLFFFLDLRLMVLSIYKTCLFFHFSNQILNCFFVNELNRKDHVLERCSEHSGRKEFTIYAPTRIINAQW